jgi:hypothetical protein
MDIDVAVVEGIFRVVARVLRSFEVRCFPARSAVAVGVPRRSCGYWLRA